MKSAVETLSPTRVKLIVEVPFEELKVELDKAYKLGQTTLDEQVRQQGDGQWRELRAARGKPRS